MKRGGMTNAFSAHRAGAVNRSQRVLEDRRRAEIERQRELKLEREIYLRGLATKLAAECGLSEETALERVRAFSVLSRQEREHYLAKFG
jgi:hypothetical protein